MKILRRSLSVFLYVAPGPTFLPDPLPKRGDIVIYRFAIPPQNKPESQRDVLIDHIGVICQIDEHGYMAAEGNVNNENISGSVCHRHHDRVDGFLRLPEDYQCDREEIDCKSNRRCQTPLPDCE